MLRFLKRACSCLIWLALSFMIVVATADLAGAEEEFPPPQGKGHVVLVDSGHDGPAAYRFVAAAIAHLGYDAVLFNANTLAPNMLATSDATPGAALRAAIRKAQQMPHALPGKVGLVGFSQGGGQVLLFGSGMPDLAAVVIAWYPVTRPLSDAGYLARFVATMKVPVLMFAGDYDHLRECCIIERARALATAAVGRQFRLVEYADVGHNFVYGEQDYNEKAYVDAMNQTAAALARYLGR